MVEMAGVEPASENIEHPTFYRLSSPTKFHNSPAGKQASSLLFLLSSSNNLRRRLLAYPTINELLDDYMGDRRMKQLLYTKQLKIIVCFRLF
jgi:hypothetical protein